MAEIDNYNLLAGKKSQNLQFVKLFLPDKNRSKLYQNRDRRYNFVVVIRMGLKSMIKFKRLEI